MRSPRSLLETIRAFRSQINSLSRLWSHPRGAAGSQGISSGSWWHCQGESTMTTLHAHTPSRLLTTAIRGLWVQAGPPPNRRSLARSLRRRHLRHRLLAYTDFGARRYWPPHYPSLLPHFSDTRRIRRARRLREIAIAPRAVRIALNEVASVQSCRLGASQTTLTAELLLFSFS